MGKPQGYLLVYPNSLEGKATYLRMLVGLYLLVLLITIYISKIFKIVVQLRFTIQDLSQPSWTYFSIEPKIKSFLLIFLLLSVLELFHSLHSLIYSRECCINIVICEKWWYIQLIRFWKYTIYLVKKLNLLIDFWFIITLLS